MGDDGKEHAVICFGPISVLPSFQRMGIGTMMIEYSKKVAKALGYTAILIYGDSDYYSKVGFVPAKRYGIGTDHNMYAVPLQACELIEGSLSHCKGRFFEDDSYNIDSLAAEEFDKTFPNKELQTNLPSQARFLQLINMRTPRL